MPQEPSFYVNVPSRVDKTAAPSSKDAIVVLVPVGHLPQPGGKGAQIDEWGSLVDRTRHLVLERLSHELKLPDF